MEPIYKETLTATEKYRVVLILSDSLNISIKYISFYLEQLHPA